MAKSFDYYFAQLRKTEDHRSKKAEVEIRKLYKEVLADTKKFVAEEYYELAENGELTYEILRSKGQAARFLSEVEQRLDGLTTKVSQEIQTAVEEMYKLSYDSMVQAVQMSQTKKELRECLEGLQGVSVDTIKAAVENPIAGLTLNDTLERNRKNIIWNIKREIGTGLTMGDRYETMAKRIAKSLDGDYKKAITIVRTETGRAREKGHLDSAKEINDALKEGSTSMRMVKTWKTMKDGRVRDTHGSMEGITVAMDEEFILPSGVKTMAPKQSGVASEDINCRCFVKYELMDDAEFYKKTGKHSEETYSETIAPAKVDWGTIPEESRESYEKVLNRLYEEYPLKKRPVSWVGDFRISNGYDLEEDFIDLTDRETQWFGVGARFVPSSKFSSTPYIEIVDPEIRVGTAEEYLGALAKIRKENGWHGKEDSFFNMVGNTETTLIHEYGHAVAYDCGLYGSAETAMPLWELFESTPKEEIEKQLSIYASSHPNEMLAEAFVQSFAPKELQSELCKKIMKMIFDARN